MDIVKAQIKITDGARIGVDSYLPAQSAIRLSGYALQCRVTTEDPEKGFTPDYGKLTAYRSAAGAGIRLDAGTAYTGAVITPFYDSLLVKVTARGHDPEEAIRRMDRALREFRIRSVHRPTWPSSRTSSRIPCLEAAIAPPVSSTRRRSFSTSRPSAIAPHACSGSSVSSRVAYVPGTGFYADGSGGRYARLCYSFPDPARISEGVRLFASVIQTEIQLRDDFGPAPENP